MLAEQQGPTVTESADSDFELNVAFAPKGANIAALMSSTSDNCGHTKQSACVTCFAAD